LLKKKTPSSREREREQHEELNKNIAALAFPIALRKHHSAMKERLNAEILRDRWLILKEETGGKVEDIVKRALPDQDTLTPPLQEGQRTDLRARLREAIESIWSPPPTGCAEEFRYEFLSASDRINTLTKVRALAATGSSDVMEKVEDWLETKRLLEGVRRRWDAVRDIQPRLRGVRDKLGELQSKVNELNAKKAQLEIQEQGYSAELSDLAAGIAQMEALKQKRGPEEDRLDLAERVREVLREIEDKLKPLCLQSLEKACTKHFREMISSEYKNHRVCFDQDDQPMLILGTKEPIYITTMSGAQKRAFGLAFTLAIADVSGEEAPIVIDTPVGNMDSEFRKRIMAYLASAAPGQLFFLSHDEEIYGEYLRVIESSCLKSCLINFKQIADGVGISTVTDNQYFAERA
jgi:DNA sulfur modification protein DndD